MEITGSIDNRWFLRFLTAKESFEPLLRMRKSSIAKIKSVGRKYAKVIRQWQETAQLSCDAPVVGEMVIEDAHRVLAKSIPWIPIGAVVGCLVIAFIVFSLIPGGAAKPSAASGDNLNTEQRIRMQDLLQSAATFLKKGHYEQAEANLLLVLEGYDCGNQEARRGLQALNPGAADSVISACGR